MRRAIFVLLAACSSANSTGGAKGKADFSYVDTTARPANIPVATGSDMTLEVLLHDPANVTFQSSAPDILRIVSSSHVAADHWFVVTHAQNDGKSTLTVQNGPSVVDTIDLEVATIAKLELPESVDVGVGKNAGIQITARSAGGQELYAPSAVSWSVDHPEIVQFWDSLRNAPYTQASGTSLQIRGIAVGKAQLAGSYGKTAVTIPVTVK